ncbi:MAG: hypothetical protein ACRELA_19905 [Candidatus Rokuibacteriota bacterium]
MSTNGQTEARRLHARFWGREGLMSHEVAMRAIDLMTREVIPAIKEYRADREKGRQRRAVER